MIVKDFNMTNANKYIKCKDALSAVRYWMRKPVFISEAIEAIPAADVVEIVRCKDCKHRDPEDKKCDCGELERAGCVFRVADDYFCAYGERWENNE